MTRITPDPLTPVERTIYLTVVSRARDARTPQPILDDQWSISLQDRLDYDFAALRMPDKEKFTVAIRGRLLDDWCRTFIANHPDAIVIELGCGLDDRACRVSPPRGVDWYDVDFDSVMKVRRRVGTPQPASIAVRELSTDATADDWLEELPSDRPVFVIADGFIPFVAPDDMVALVRRIVAHFPTGEIVMNGYTTLASRLLKHIHAIRAIGLDPGTGTAFDDPRSPESWDPKLRLREQAMLSRSPFVARMPWGQRLACRVLNWFPRLATQSDIGALRYGF